MPYKLRALATIFSIVFSTCIYADTQSEIFSKSGNNVFVITEQKISSRMRLDIAIANWKVDCTKSRAVVWGQTLNKLPTGVVPYTKIYIVNIAKKQILNSYTRSLRVQGAIDFYPSNGIITVDEDVINYTTGKLKQMEIPVNLEQEKCVDFSGRSLKSID